MEITVKQTISDDLIKGLISTAFEGGSNYWYTDLHAHLPAGKTIEDYEVWHRDLPLDPEGGVWFKDQFGDGGPYILNRFYIRKGLQRMAGQYPKHFADLQGEYDATTADVFLQCCVLDKLVYG